jgi:hypothetical protein
MLFTATQRAELVDELHRAGLPLNVVPESRFAVGGVVPPDRRSIAERVRAALVAAGYEIERSALT